MVIDNTRARTQFTLDGQLYYLSNLNPVSIDPASDFTQGVKTGPADYDQRLHAFFQAFDDLSGGMGYDVVSAREESSLYFNSELGADTRRGKHITGPPHIQKIYSTSIVGTFTRDRFPISSDNNIAHFPLYMVLGYPTFGLYTTDGIGFTKATMSPGGDTPTKLIRFTVGVNAAVVNIYAVFAEATAVGASLLSFRSTDGITWTATAKFALWDLIFADEHFWSMGDSGVGVGTAYPAAVPTGLLPSGHGQFIGLGRGPTGDIGMFFHKAGKLYQSVRVANFYNSSTGLVDKPALIEYTIPINIAPGFYITGGVIFKGALLLTNGFSMLQVTASSATEVIRNIGFQEFRADIEELNGSFIKGLCSDEGNVYVAVQKTSTVRVYAYNERGWSVVGEIPDDFYLHTMGVGWTPPNNSWPITRRALYLTGEAAGSAGSSEIARPTGNGVHTVWTGVYTAVDEAVADDADYIESLNNNSAPFTDPTGDKESYTHGGITTPGSSTISKVTLYYRARKVNNSPVSPSAVCSVKPFLRISGSDYLSATAQTLTTSFVEYSYEWALNPATGAAWLEAAVDAMEIGMRLHAVGSYIEDDGLDPPTLTAATYDQARVSQMWIVVTYVTANATVYEVNIPALEQYPSIDRDRFARTWDLTTPWNDGGFVDLQGALYSILASGVFTDTEYVEVYYSLDNDEDTETLLGTITEDNQTLFWGNGEGVEFATYRLHLKGYAGVPDETYNDVGQISASELLGSATTRSKIAQSFKVDAATSLHGVLIQIAKVAAPVDNVTITIETNSGSAPSGVILATSTIQTGAQIETTRGWRYFDFASMPELAGATTYWFVIQRSAAVDAVNHYSIGADTSSPGYADGEAKVLDSGGPTWSALTADLIFEIITDKTKTADLKTFVVAYDKRPDYRAQFQVEVDIEAMIEDGIEVDGVAPTFESVYARLVRSWNSKTLVSYELPGIRSNYCRIAAMPVVAQSVGEDGVEVNGNIVLQLLEPVVGKE